MERRTRMSKIGDFFERHSGPLLGIGTVSAFGVALWRMYVSSPYIHNIIEDEKLNWEEAKTKEEQKRIVKRMIRDIFIESWPIAGAAATGVVLEAMNVHQANAKIGEYAFLYSTTKDFTDRLQKATREELGDAKAKEIHDRAVSSYAKDPECVIPTVNIVDGDWVVYDTVSKQSFVSNRTKVQAALNKAYDQCRQGNFVDYAGFLLELGGDISKVPDDLCMKGWDIDDGVVEPVWNPDFDENGRPIALLSYSVEPKEQRRYLLR
jgi:hypothetical protein